MGYGGCLCVRGEERRPFYEGCSTVVCVWGGRGRWLCACGLEGEGGIGCGCGLYEEGLMCWMATGQGVVYKKEKHLMCWMDGNRTCGRFMLKSYEMDALSTSGVSTLPSCKLELLCKFEQRKKRHLTHIQARKNAHTHTHTHTHTRTCTHSGG